MRKWDILIAGDDGRAFTQNFHVVESSADAAQRYLLENFPDPEVRATVKIQSVRDLEDATLFLPGIVLQSDKAYTP